MKYFVYQSVALMSKSVNRAQRREMDQEYKRLTEKVEKACVNFEREISSIKDHDPYNEMYKALFHAHNENYQYMVDRISQSIRFHGVHRGFFYMLYAPEEIGVQRHEERTLNTLKRIFSTPLNVNVAKMLS